MSDRKRQQRWEKLLGRNLSAPNTGKGSEIGEDDFCTHFGRFAQVKTKRIGKEKLLSQWR